MGSTALLLFLALLGGALFGSALAWRTVQREAPDLPVWQLLRRAGIGRASLDGRRAFEAEVRCALCPARAECCKSIAAGAGAPEDCPNRALLQAKPV